MQPTVWRWPQLARSKSRETLRERMIQMFSILILILILAALASMPAWPYSRGWGYYPSGGLGLALLVVVLYWYFST
jgi:hypothetical protein